MRGAQGEGVFGSRESAVSDLFSGVGMRKDALLSPDRVYRYWLLRQWDEGLPMAAIIGVNPSTADATVDDQTIRKDIGFMRRLGYGGFVKLNLSAYRARDPKRAVGVGIDLSNSAYSLAEYARQFGAVKVIAAWGANGNAFPVQRAAVVDVFDELWCWGRCADGNPRHPLMLSYDTPLERYSPPDDAPL